MIFLIDWLIIYQRQCSKNINEKKEEKKREKERKREREKKVIMKAIKYNKVLNVTQNQPNLQQKITDQYQDSDKKILNLVVSP